MTLFSTAASRPASTQTASQKAPVFHYSCLFTHDIRRKNTKRWQDGYLSLHSFNGRIMVYDSSRNYIGDAYNKEPSLDDGQELTLDRMGVLVQVGERQGVQETDLTELLAKRVRKPVEQEKEQHQASAVRNTSTTPLKPQAANTRTPAHTSYTGWTGTAKLSTVSPFASRQAELSRQKENVEPPRKKQRVDDEHVPLWQILKTSRPQRPRAVRTTAAASPILGRTGEDNKEQGSGKKVPSGRQAALKVTDIIDMTADSSDRVNDMHEAGEIDIPDDARLAPPLITPSRFPPREAMPTSDSRFCSSGITADWNNVIDPTTPIRTVQARNGPVNRSLPSIASPQDTTIQGPEVSNTTQKARKDRASGLTIAKDSHIRTLTGPNLATEAPQEISRPPSPPISTTSKTLPPPVPSPESPATPDPNEASTTKPPPPKESRPLRLASAAPRKKLFCQTLSITGLPPESVSGKAANAQRNKSKSTSREGSRKRATHSPAQDTNKSRSAIELDEDDSQHSFETMAPKRTKRRRFGEDPSPKKAQQPISRTSQAATAHRSPKHATNPVVQKPFTTPSKATVPPLEIAPDSVDYGSTIRDSQLLAQPIAPAALTIHETASTIFHAGRDAPEPHPALDLAVNLATIPPRTRNAASNPTVPPALHRPFRRVASETSPSSVRRHAPLRRAETISGPQSHEAEAPQVEAAAVDADSGPWSREAWDLFGWCPAEKAEGLAWGYAFAKAAGAAGQAGAGVST